MKLILAEFIKMKWSAIPYIVAFVLTLISGILLFSYSLDNHMVINIGENPWVSFCRTSFGLFSLILLIPLAVLIVSSSVFTEHRANAWKYLYTLPQSRAAIYFSKLLSLLCVIYASLLGLLIVTLGSGYLLSLSFPEMEFTYFQPEFNNLFSTLNHCFVSLLGVIGLQYYISLRFKNILLSVGLGLFGFVMALILTSIPKKVILFMPFTLPMVVQDFGMMNFPHRTQVMSSWLTNVELYSIAFFVFFIMLGCVLEIKRNVD